ncbi:hypothetical protein NitYY0918_C0222 [Nitratiruptor sp. YY09-18]|nr:hypothetical protein NitYY0918_C0222 [Nitratiruptor sp. YY09-18]
MQFVFFGIELILVYVSYKLAYLRIYGSKQSYESKKTAKKHKAIKIDEGDIEKYQCAKDVVSQFSKECKEDNENEFIAKIDKCLDGAKQPDGVIEKVLNDYIQEALNDGLLDEKEECTIMTLSQNYNIDLENIEDLQKAKILYSIIVKNEIPDVEVRGNIPVLLENNETILYAENGVALIKEVTKTKYVGGSDGFSIRIAKGLYYRKSAFKGERVKVSSQEVVDAGTLIISSKNIFFVGENQKIKIPIKRIITSEPFENGLTIQKSGRAKPLTFYGLDSWFAHNLIINLAKIE